MKREREKGNKRKETLLGPWLSSSLLPNHLRRHRLRVVSCVFGYRDRWIGETATIREEETSAKTRREYDCLFLLLFVDLLRLSKVITTIIIMMNLCLMTEFAVNLLRDFKMHQRFTEEEVAQPPWHFCCCTTHQHMKIMSWTFSSVSNPIP